MIKTGECYWRDEEGRLWLAQSYQDDDGVVVTQSTEMTADIEPQA